MFEKDKHDLVEIVYRGQRIKVTKEVADYLEECRRDMHRQSKKKKRNQDGTQCEEDYIEELMAIKPTGFEDELIWRLEQERLPGLIALLPEVQRRRLTAYYYEGLTYHEIGKRENVHHSAVIRSVDLALKNLKKYF
ncbi:MAG: hypothetical protein FWF79_06260 [Defluviitaleaceae bacterium]|nr:hypothetical protein [Defluviitaleaceae bacterium]